MNLIPFVTHVNSEVSFIIVATSQMIIGVFANNSEGLHLISIVCIGFLEFCIFLLMNCVVSQLN